MLAIPSFLRESSPYFLAIILSGTYLLYALARGAVTAYQRSVIRRENGCKSIPSFPHKDPVFGLDFFVEGSRLFKTGGFLARTVERFDCINGGVNTYSQIVMGKRVIVTREPENIKAVLATQFKEFGLTHRRMNTFTPLLGHGIFTSDGKQWEASRALLRPSFARSLIGDLEVFEGHVSKMIARIPQNGSTVDLQELFFMLTLDSATDFLFGKSTEVLGTGLSSLTGEKFGKTFEYVTASLGRAARLGKLAVLFPDPEFKHGLKYIHEFIQVYVHEALGQRSILEKAQQVSSKYVFLEQLALTGCSAKKIQDELLNVLLAGRDTTAGCLSHLWYTIATRPDVFEKLRAEVQRLEGAAPSFEQLKDMKYLQYCLNETLRLYPLVPLNGRVAVDDAILPLGGGPDGKSPILVKAGTEVSYNTWAMHRRKDIYGPDADEFRPERWEKCRQGWQYLPFSGGPRICIGQQFALTEAGYTTVRLLQAYKSLENRGCAGEYKEQFMLSLTVRGGVKVALTPA